MTKALMIVGKIYVWLATAVIVASYGMIWWTSGFWAMADILSPFNLIGWATVVVTLAPGLALMMWSERRAARGV